MNFIIYFLLAFCFIKVSDGVMCYWCSGVGNDRECEQHPYAVQTGPVFLNCRAHFCLSVKVIDADSGTVKSFARLCDNVPRENVCIQDSKLLTCYESCTDDLCNNGNPDPEFLPITNYASDTTKTSKGNKTNKITNGGLKGNIFEQYGISKTGRGSSVMKSKEHLLVMENARKRLLSNAVRGSKTNGIPHLLESQMRLPLSRKEPQIVTEATLNMTKSIVQYITDTTYRATLKPSHTPVVSASNSTTLFSTSSKKSDSRITSEMTPITTLALVESTNSMPPSASKFDKIKQTTLSDFPFSSSSKMPKVNDIHYKTSITSDDGGKNSPTFKPNEYTFGASNPSGSSRGLTLKPTWLKKSTPKRITARITTFKADVSSKEMTEKVAKTTTHKPKKIEVTQIIKPQTNEKQTIKINLKHPLKSLILPNNVANLEKPVTAIDANSYAELHGLEETEGPENTFAFNSHPRNPNLPKHKHRIGHSKKIESSNGIVIWPMKESPREEDISNSIFSEDKEEAIIEPYRGNSTSVNPKGGDESKTPDNNKINNVDDTANEGDDKQTPYTPITTVATSKTSTINTVSLPIEPSKDVNGVDHIKTVLNRKTPTKISLKGKSKIVSNEKTTTPSPSLDKSTRLYASKLSEVWNEVKTTVIVDKHDDLPIPPEYTSFFEDDELIEYPVFENEASSFKDTTEDQLLVASYQDESDSSSKRPSIVLLFVIHVLTFLFSYFLS